MDNSTVVRVAGLTKTFGRARGVSDLTFDVHTGEVFGYLGPNGAGKTTTIRLLMGLIRPTAGSATIAGFDCWLKATEVRRLVGYLPGEWTFDPTLTGAQILQYLANLRGGVDVSYRNRLIERFGLDPSRRFREYSHGNKQKVGLIQAFMHQPRLLILDEPTIGLDPLNQQEFYALLAETRTAKQTVFLSSHVLAEVEHMCDRVGIIREGQLVTVDEIARLKELKQHSLEITFDTPPSTAWFDHVPGVLEVSDIHGGQTLRLSVQGDLSAIIERAASHHATNVATEEPSLEDIFLRFYSGTTPPAARPEAVAADVAS